MTRSKEYSTDANDISRRSERRLLRLQRRGPFRFFTGFPVTLSVDAARSSLPNRDAFTRRRSRLRPQKAPFSPSRRSKRRRENSRLIIADATITSTSRRASTPTISVGDVKKNEYAGLRGRDVLLKNKVTNLRISSISPLRLDIFRHFGALFSVEARSSGLYS